MCAAAAVPHGPVPRRPQISVITSGTCVVSLYRRAGSCLPASVGAGRTLAMLGGVRYGGYSGDVGDLSLLHFEFGARLPGGAGTAGAAGAREEVVLSARWEPMHGGGRLVETYFGHLVQTACDSRAYHSAAVARMPGGRDALVVFGGIHEACLDEGLLSLSFSNSLLYG